MKFLSHSLLVACIALSGSVARADNFPDFNAVLGTFYASMGTLKTPDNKSVAQQFADDTLQHFSGSDGDRVRLRCENPLVAGEAGATTSCDVVVTIYYGHHGEENGTTETATYTIGVLKTGKALEITSVKRTLTASK